MSAGAPRPRAALWEWLAALGLCLAVVAAWLRWPGDTQWVNDEPLFLLKAAQLNAGGGLTGEGLRGTVGLAYGPIAVWLYAGLLRLAPDLLSLVALRTALFGGLLAGALLWLAKTARLRPVALVLALVSPYAWIYGRQIWDNTWLMPLGALALAGYASFQDGPARWKLAVATLSLALAVLIHPMVLPLALALLVHALRYHRAWLRRHLPTVALLLGASLLLAAPWLVSLWRQLGAPPPPPPPAPPLAPPDTPAASAVAPWLFALLGGRQLSALGVGYFLDGAWPLGGGLRALAAWTFVAYGLVWLGMGLAVARVRAGWRGTRPRDLDFHLALICLGALAVQWLMQGALRRHTHPHYYNGTWICYVYFLGVALSAPVSGGLRAARLAVGAGLFGALVLLTAHLAVGLHRTGGTRGIHYGATLAAQLDVARTLGRFHPDSPVRIEVTNWLMFPHALPILRRMTGTVGDPAAPRQNLLLRYRDRGADTGWLAVDVLPTP